MNQLPHEPSATSSAKPEFRPFSLARLTVPVRSSLQFAELQCAGEGLTVIDASHLFAGFLLIDSQSSNGHRLLSELGVDVQALASSLRNSGFISAQTTWPPAPALSPTTGHLSMGPEAQELFSTASTIADGFGHERVGSEHILLALLATPECFGYRVLGGFGVTLAAAREHLVTWLASGTYQSEGAVLSAPAITAVRIGALGPVYQVYQWTRIGYMILIFVPFALTFFVSSKVAPSLYNYLQVMGSSIYLYVLPYVISTYTLGYLLRSRAQRGLFQTPPSRAMVGLGTPFALCSIFGFLLILGLVPMLVAFFGSKLIVRGGLEADIPALIGGILVTLNSITTVITHWLLTFNIQGTKVQIPRQG